MERLRVLVVDDNASILRFLSAGFGAHDCDVARAGTAEDAIELVSTEKFDLVVSDIRMPGLSGLDLLRAVKRRQPGTPVALMTGAPSVNSAIFGMRHGAYDYLPKPFTVKEIAELVQRVRRDRVEHTAGVLPAGLTDDLARRQRGVEVLFRIGELAVDGIDAATFPDTVLGYSLQGLHGTAAVLLLREADGTIKTSRRGDPDALAAVTATLEPAFEGIARAGARDTVHLSARGMVMIAASVPGSGNATGLLCVARDETRGAFLPDEAELLRAYARAVAVAMQNIQLREGLEATSATHSPHTSTRSNRGTAA